VPLGLTIDHGRLDTCTALPPTAYGLDVGEVKAHTAGGVQRFGDLVGDLPRVGTRTLPPAIIAQLNDLSQSSTPPQVSFARGHGAPPAGDHRRGGGEGGGRWAGKGSNKQSGEDGNDIEVEITNAPSGLCSSSLAAPFSERALYPKA
jgi:hypothetical protein